MGYRSQVYLGVDPEIVEQLLTYVGINKKVYELLFEHSDYAKRTEKGGMHFHWDYVKWYDSFEAIVKLSSWIQEHDSNIKFLRIGENTDDIEEEGYSEQFYFEVRRVVEVYLE